MKGWLPVLQRFTPRAKQLVVQAVQEARLRNQPVGPEHLLLALSQSAEGLEGATLRDLGVTADGVASHLPDPVPEPDAPKREPPFSPTGKRVLEAAAEKARKLAHTYIGTEHILLALADERTGGEGASILKELGVDLATLPGILFGRPRLIWTEARGAGTNRDWVVSVRLDEPTLTAVDGLVRAGVAKSRSEAVFLLCRKGIDAHRELFDRLAEKMASVAEIEQEMRQIFSGEAGGKS
ncbi:MAG: Clp protease N-terminal domain-containing protein [Bacillota bacterium]